MANTLNNYFPAISYFIFRQFSSVDFNYKKTILTKIRDQGTKNQYGTQFDFIRYRILKIKKRVALVL